MKIKVKVKPNSKQQNIEMAEDGSFIVCLKSAPVEGKANQELIELLAARFAVRKSQVAVKSGLSARNKWVEIEL
jgi:uncharacterized protein (TIGR00251 family)